MHIQCHLTTPDCDDIVFSINRGLYGEYDMDYIDVQMIARETMIFARDNIRSGMMLADVRELCEKRMLDLGADSFWYWGIGAFVFAGDETALSVSGREYKTSDRVIDENDIITIDLSPQRDGIWGDYARTLIVENGTVADDGACSDQEWKKGIETEKELHAIMRSFVTPQTTFEELYFHMNKVIEELGYINLDFLGNLGHSIAKQKDARLYIEKGNTVRLGDAAFFTFEPHIGLARSKYGYKREDIYHFENDELIEL